MAFFSKIFRGKGRTAGVTRDVAGLFWSQVCLEGDRLDIIEPLLRGLKYEVGEVRDIEFGELLHIIDYSNPVDPRNRKIAYVADGWTRLIDPEMVVFCAEPELADVSAAQGCSIVGWVVEKHSGTIGFNVYRQGRLVRDVLAVGGTVEEKGERLPSEGSIDWARADEEDLKQVLASLGPAFTGLQPTFRYRLYELINVFGE